MKKINSSSIPADPPTQLINGYRVWEKPSARGITVTFQSVDDPKRVYQTEARTNAIAFSINTVVRSLMHSLEQLENANTPHP